MTGESSAVSENPDQSPIGRGSERINASLMPHGVATALVDIGAALAPIRVDLSFLSRRARGRPDAASSAVRAAGNALVAILQLMAMRVFLSLRNV